MRKIELLLVIVVAVVMSSCSKYAHVSLNYPIEPKVYLPEQVDEIAVVNRSLTSEEAKEGKVIESIVSSEIAGSDKRASDECVKGVYSAAQNWQGTVVVIPEVARMEGTGTREVPDLLDWDLVSEVCKKENVDALLVLETFDSNTDLFKQAAVQQVSSLLSTGKVTKPTANEVNMNIVCFWRLYEPASKTIIDQYQDNRTLTFRLVGGLPPPNMLPESAYDAGVRYVNRFLPNYYTVRREFYKKAKGDAKQQFKVAMRKAEVANWNGAMEVWLELSEGQTYKTAGRACLNVAVAYEVIGNTEEALIWAKKAYEDYGDKTARNYAKDLMRRKRIEGR